MLRELFQKKAKSTGRGTGGFVEHGWRWVTVWVGPSRVWVPGAVADIMEMSDDFTVRWMVYLNWRKEEDSRTLERRRVEIERLSKMLPK